MKFSQYLVESEFKLPEDARGWGDDEIIHQFNRYHDLMKNQGKIGRTDNFKIHHAFAKWTRSIENPSEKILNMFIDNRNYYVVYEKDQLPASIIKRMCLDEGFINMRDKYPGFIKKHFAGNTLLINKWLRYADSIRRED